MPIYLQINGIAGESTESQFPGWIEIQSFSWGESNPVTSSSNGGSVAGKVSFSDFNFTKTLSKGSPKLMIASVTGQRISNAVLAVTDASHQKQQTYLEITLTGILISSYQISGDSGGKPSDSFTIYFEKLEMAYTYNNPDGTSVTQEDTISRSAFD